MAFGAESSGLWSRYGACFLSGIGLQKRISTSRCACHSYGPRSRDALCLVASKVCAMFPQLRSVLGNFPLVGWIDESCGDLGYYFIRHCAEISKLNRYSAAQSSHILSYKALSVRRWGLMHTILQINPSRYFRFSIKARDLGSNSGALACSMGGVNLERES